MAEGYSFDRQSVERIAASVKWTERQPTPNASQTAPHRLNKSGIHWQRGLNGSGEEIPPFSCVELGVGIEDGGIYHASLGKPTADGKVYGLTGRHPIPQSESGGYHVEAGIACYDTGTPAVGETWGPKEGQWTLAKDKPGFVCLGVIDSDAKLMLVTPERGSGVSTKLVTIGGEGENGELVEPGSGCLWEGTLASVSESEEGGYCSEPITAGDPVWIFNAARLAPEKLPKGSRHWAVPAGSFDPHPPDPEEEPGGGEDPPPEEPESDERPVYVILYEDVAGKVKVNEDDELAYLEDQFEGHNAEPAYEDGKDLTLSLDTEEIEGEPPPEGEDPPPADQKLRIFIDASAIAGYDAAKEQILTHEADGGFRWVDVNTEECEE